MESFVSSRLAALSHPQRMAIFRLLMRRCPDALPAGEIAGILGLKPSTASVYLSALLRAGLIRQHRAGTSLRYEVNLEAARGLVSDLFLDCCRGRPDLCPPLAQIPLWRPEPKFNVLFICTGNSARSILAEAILRHEAGDRFNAFSAGAHPAARPTPLAIETLAEQGIDVTGLRAKTISEFRGVDAPRLDFVFTVCDLAANEDCPAWSGQPITGHWGLPDPVKATGSEAEKRLAFRRCFGAMRARILAFAALPLATSDRAHLQNEVDAIGRTPETA